MGGHTVGEWTLFIKNELDFFTETRKTRVKCTMFRVPPAMRRRKPEHFEPGLMTFGLFNRNLSKPSRVDTYRLDVASAFLETLDKTNADWDAICRMVVPDPTEILKLYDDPLDMPLDLVRYFLTLDAIFLASLLATGLVSPEKFPLLENVVHQEGLFSHVIGYPPVDVMLLENQIPLFLIRNVLEILYGVEGPAIDLLLSKIYKEAIVKYSRFGSVPGSDRLHTYVENVVTNVALTSDCRHLLDYLYRAMCHGVNKDSDSWVEDMRSHVSLPTVSQLKAAGIRFKGDARGISDIKFSHRMFKATLYLPKLVLDTTTERMWRNLVAFESVRADRQCEFMCYLELMDDLIDTHRDVELLRKGRDPVISHNFLGSDKKVATMFNSLLHDCHTSRSPKWIQLRQEIAAYYNKKYIKLYVEFTEIYFTKPWVVVSLLIATVLLALTLYQGIDAIYTQIKIAQGSS